MSFPAPVAPLTTVGTTAPRWSPAALQRQTGNQKLEQTFVWGHQGKPHFCGAPRPQGAKKQDLRDPGGSRGTLDPPCLPVSLHCPGTSMRTGGLTPGNDSAPFHLRTGGSCREGLFPGPRRSGSGLYHVVHYPGPQAVLCSQGPQEVENIYRTQHSGSPTKNQGQHTLL